MLGGPEIPVCHSPERISSQSQEERRCQSLKTCCDSDSEVEKKRSKEKHCSVIGRQNEAATLSGKKCYSIFNLDRARTSGLLVSGSVYSCSVFRCVFLPPSFPKPWHWGVCNGSTCCNRTCALLPVAKILQQPLH